jgi:hypothetical protein
MLTVGAPDMTRFMFLAYCILQLAQADSDPKGTIKPLNQIESPA